MRGVPADLDLTFLQGTQLSQVCLGMYQIQFHFHPHGSISVGGNWELTDDRGRVIDRHYETPRQDAYQFHRVLGRDVERTEIEPPSSFAVRFTGGLVLRVFAEISAYEDVWIQPGDVVL
jgi:hypothetical protein